MENILVVDDETELWKICQSTLENSGYMVHAASTADHAVELLEDVSFDVAFVDLRMPGRIDGLDLLKMVRERFSRTDVIIVTADETIETAVECLKAGAFDYILKPFHLSELLDGAKISLALRQLRKRQPVSMEGEYFERLFDSAMQKNSRKELLKAILEMAVKTLRADEGSIHLYVPERNSLRMISSTGSEVEKENEVKLGERIVGWVAKNRQPMIIQDKLHEHDQFKQLSIRNEIASSMIVPLVKHNLLLGALCLNRMASKTNVKFTDDDLLLLRHFAIHSSLTLFLQHRGSFF